MGTKNRIKKELERALITLGVGVRGTTGASRIVEKGGWGGQGNLGGR